MHYIPDPVELLGSRIEAMQDKYVDEYTCMACSKKVDYELYCLSPMGDGPAVCFECTGWDPAEYQKWEEESRKPYQQDIDAKEKTMKTTALQLRTWADNSPVGSVTTTNIPSALAEQTLAHVNTNIIGTQNGVLTITLKGKRFNVVQQ